jgi:hypothetical protein
MLGYYHLFIYLLLFHWMCGCWWILPPKLLAGKGPATCDMSINNLWTRSRLLGYQLPKPKMTTLNPPPSFVEGPPHQQQQPNIIFCTVLVPGTGTLDTHTEADVISETT